MQKHKNKWLRFAIGLALVAGLFFTLAYAPPPPGVAGEVVRHNLEQDIDAYVLFYQELDKMPSLQRHLETIRHFDQ